MELLKFHTHCSYKCSMDYNNVLSNFMVTKYLTVKFKIKWQKFKSLKWSPMIAVLESIDIAYL